MRRRVRERGACRGGMCARMSVCVCVFSVVESFKCLCVFSDSYHSVELFVRLALVVFHCFYLVANTRRVKLFLTSAEMMIKSGGSKAFGSRL